MQEDQIAQRSKIISYILMVVLVVGFAGYYMFSNQTTEDNARITFRNEGALVLHPQMGEAVTVPYDSLTAVSLETSPDYGDPTGGAFRDGLREGHWHSATYGDYTASADEAIPCAIWLQSESGSYVINLESEAVTKSLYQSLDKLIGTSHP